MHRVRRRCYGPSHAARAPGAQVRASGFTRPGAPPPARAPTPPRGVRRQFVAILASRGLGSALQAVALVLLARSVPAAEFGVVNVVIGVVGLLLVATGFGMSVYVPRARALGQDDDVAAGLRLNAVANLATAVVLLAALAAWASSTQVPLGVLLIGASLALERNVDTVLGVPVADGDALAPAVSMVLRRTITLAVLVPGLALGLDPVWSYTGGLLAGALAAQLHVRRVVRRLPGRASAVGTSTLLRRSWPYLVSNLTGQVRTLDTTLVAIALTPAAAGLYAAAAKLVQPLLLVPQTIAAVITPHATRLDPAAARRLGLRLVLAFAACLVLGIPIMVWAEEIVVLVMGEQYAGGGPVLAWCLAGLPFIAMSASLGALLQGQGRARMVAVNGLVFAVVLVVVVLGGALIGGVVGAAGGLSGTYLLRATVLAWAVRSLRPGAPGPAVTPSPAGAAVDCPGETSTLG